MSKAKKILSHVKKIAWGIFLAVFGLIAVVALWLTIDKFVLKSPVPSIFGYAALTVETGSMAGNGETSINPGDMIIICPQKEYKTGEVITYLHEGDTIPTTHRIIFTNEDGTFVTKGDANNSKDPEAVSEVNELLHSYADKIVGRMGLPYRDRGISVISIIIDAPADEISALAGKLGKIEGISAKTMQSKF